MLSLPWDSDHQTSHKLLPKMWISGSHSVLRGQLTSLLEAGSFWESALIFQHYPVHLSVNRAHQVLPCQASMAGHPPEPGNICRAITRAGAQPTQTCLCFYKKRVFPHRVAVEGRLCWPETSWIQTDPTVLRQTFVPNSHAKLSSRHCQFVLTALQDTMTPDTRRTFHCEILHRSEG